jgi:8-oxo-dGTP pyrophosphatase MutT (NUDIX family)
MVKQPLRDGRIVRLIGWSQMVATQALNFLETPSPVIMPAIQKRSFGIIPVAFEQDGSPVFLILRAYKNWDFPKGGAEVGEGPLEVARREMIEETGIQKFTLDWGEVSMDTEVYAAGKVATYYPARVERQQLALPVSAELGRPEHDEYRWVSYDEARSLLPLRLIPILDWAKGLAARNWDN